MGGSSGLPAAGAQEAATTTHVHAATLTEGPVGRRLFYLALPMVAGMFSTVAFHLADTAFVAQLGTRPLAAMGFTFPVVMLIGSVAMGLGMGTAAVLSRAIGRGDHEEVRRLTTDSLMLSLLTVVIFAGIGLATINPMFGLLGAERGLLPMIREYMTIWYVGIVFLIIPMVGNNAIRASGNTLWPSLIMIFGAGLNVLLDPPLIFGWWGLPRLGLAGAAVATVLSRAATLVASLAVLHFNRRMLTFRRPSLAQVWGSWRRILFIGIPAAATNIMYPLTIGAITRMVAVFGEPAVAAAGAGMRVEAFAMMVIWALAVSLLPFVGQNLGAGRIRRAHLAQKYSYAFSAAWGLFCWAVLAAVSYPVARLFSDEPEVLRRMRHYLWILPVCYGMRGVCVLTGAVFNAMHRPLSAAALNVLRFFGLYIPLAWIGGRLIGLNGVFGGVAAANLVAGTVALLWTRRVRRRQKQTVVSED